jgi:OPA family glycerol-3-phosphate transporter-like MFS transporter
MAAVLVLATLAIVIFLYFRYNPLGHASPFMVRRFLNWFPLGMSYAFLYMARYNLNVASNAFGKAMDNEAFGLIFGVGTFVYALSLVFNGPLVDKVGGKCGILIATIGASMANALLGVVTYLFLHNSLPISLTLAFCILYPLNMFFQSFGAVSIIKNKSYWFHVRERGIFGAIFGTLISFGVYFAFDWNKAIADAAKAHAEPGVLTSLMQTLFGTGVGEIDAVWFVFFIPAAILLVWAALDWFLVHDTPAHAKFKDFDTHDASSGEMHVEFTKWQILKRIVSHPIIITLSVIELMTGVLRNGVMQWYPKFSAQVPQGDAAFFSQHWGLVLCMTGIIAGFTAGHVSDKIFHSRRGPPVALAMSGLLVAALLMSFTLMSAPMLVGVCAVTLCFLSIAVHSLMSGTAAADFGGRKMTATAAGFTDAFVYLGASVQSVGVGRLVTHHDWTYWPVFLIPFAIGGLILGIRMWRALPEATRQYLAEVENVKIAGDTTTVSQSESAIAVASH